MKESKILERNLCKALKKRGITIVDSSNHIDSDEQTVCNVVVSFTDHLLHKKVLTRVECTRFRTGRIHMVCRGFITCDTHHARFDVTTFHETLKDAVFHIYENVPRYYISEIQRGWHYGIV